MLTIYPKALNTRNLFSDDPLSSVEVFEDQVAQKLCPDLQLIKFVSGFFGQTDPEKCSVPFWNNVTSAIRDM